MLQGNFRTLVPASADAAGTLSAALYGELTGTAPTDPTAAIATTGASGSYTEVTVTGLASTLSPDSGTVTANAYDRCNDTGHAGASLLVPFINCPGFGVDKAGISTALKRRQAGYVDPISLRAPLSIGITTRGRGVAGTVDYVRDTQDRFDILDHAAAAVGSNVFGAGRSCVLVGYSTGALDAMLAACRCPDRVLAVILYFPNFDIGVDPTDSYWALQSPANRTTMTTQIGNRAQGAASALDPYLVRNAIDGLARIMATPGGPHVWILGDRTEAPTVPIPGPDRLAAALRAIPGAAAKCHVHITQTGDSNRILHGDGVDGAGAIYAERYWVPYVLANATEWHMPRESPPGGYRVFGWLKTRAVTGSTNAYDDRPALEIWTGTSNPPKASATGGQQHVCELEYLDAGKQFVFNPITSQNGYLEIIRDLDDRTVALTAGTPLRVDLNVSPTVTSLSSIGFAHEFRADMGTTGDPVSAWADQIGALSAAEATNKPDLTTDADGKSLLRFASASSTKLVINSLLVNPKSDFTIIIVVNKTNATAETILACSHHGTSAELRAVYNSAFTVGTYLVDSGAAGAANVGQTGWTQNAKHMLAFMRHNGVMYMSLDGSAWSYATVTADTFTTTGTNTTSFGAAWADGGGAYWLFLDGDLYEVASKNAATSEADINGIWALMKTRWTM